jgi:uncharacterized protein YabE (DUF348 family)
VSVRAQLSRPWAAVLQASVLVALVGGVAGYAMTEKTVTVSLDGQARRVTTHGGTVRDALVAAHITPGPHDVVAPPAETSIGSGDRVAVRRGRLLALVLDGQRRNVWVTASSVDEALAQLGVRDGSVVSASRSRPIPLSGLELEVLTPKAVAILDNGHVRVLTTAGPTVRDALMQAHVVLSRTDAVAPARETPLSDHLTIRITRVVGREVTESIAIPFRTEQRPDPGMLKGDTRVLVAGHPGVILRTYALSFVNGRLTAKRLTGQRQTAVPVTQVVAVGTKPRPAMERTYSSNGDGLNWPALARCESGGNPRAVSSSGAYRGLYQFSFSTWRGVGGSGDPIDATPSEQTYRAQILYSRSGRSPWPVCGKYL